MSTEPPRNGNGVRHRVDGGGDPWALAHRQAVPAAMYLTDIDAFVAMTAFGRNGGDTLFMEYTPDAYANRGKIIRRFGLVALFERKRTTGAAKLDGSKLSLGVYLHFCRTYASQQPVPPRFFFVYGDHEPYTMQEIDINTGDPVGESVVLPNASVGWAQVWRLLGLTDAHATLSKWLQSRP